MYLIKHFLGKEYEEYNKILNDYSRCQNSTINLTACVSYPFKEILDVQAFPLSTLPTEGTVGKRFFPAYKCMDDIENFAMKEALKLFGISKKSYSVTIQPNSGTQANQIVYNAILNDGDIVLALNPKDGGHISHSKLGCRNVKVIYYHLNRYLEMDYDELENLINMYSPKIIIVGASSYTKEFNYKKIHEMVQKRKIYLLADICHSVLYIAGKIHSPIFPYVDFATFTMDKTLCGPQGGVIIYKNKFNDAISQSVFPKTQGGPIQNLLFAKALCFLKLNTININNYAINVIENACLLAQVLDENGVTLVTKVIRNHIILVDLSHHQINGKELENILYKYKIIVNRNQIPNDSKGVMTTSGIRIGVTPITNLGYKKSDVIILGTAIAQIIRTGTTDINLINSLILKYHSQINISN